jgi:hypothetical protein
MIIIPIRIKTPTRLDTIIGILAFGPSAAGTGMNVSDSSNQSLIVNVSVGRNGLLDVNTLEKLIGSVSENLTVTLKPPVELNDLLSLNTLDLVSELERLSLNVAESFPVTRKPLVFVNEIVFDNRAVELN